jgi:predicted O-methyltransferase YrrM
LSLIDEAVRPDRGSGRTGPTLTEITHALGIQGWMEPPELAFLQAIAYSLPEGARMVEVGSWRGRSTVAIGRVLAGNPGARLYAVDTFEGDPAVLKGHEVHGVEAELRANTLRFSDLLEVIVADSVAGAGLFDDSSLDCVFIDADHRYRNVLADIRAWTPKLKPEGLLCGHDFGQVGVTLAVCQCFGRNVPHWQTIWFTREPIRNRMRFALEAALRNFAGRL